MASLPSLRERKKTQTRHDIIAAAIELFQTKGFEETTVEEIVERANYSRPTFFRYFSTKEDVLFSGVTERLEVFKRLLRSPAVGDTPWERAEQALTTLIVGFFTGTPPEPELPGVALWFEEGRPRRRYLEVVDTWEGVLADYLIEEWGEGAFLEAKVIAAAIHGVGRAAVEAHLRTGEPIQELMEAGFDLLKISVGDLGGGSARHRPRARTDRRRRGRVTGGPRST